MDSHDGKGMSSGCNGVKTSATEGLIGQFGSVETKLNPGLFRFQDRVVGCFSHNDLWG